MCIRDRCLFAGLTAARAANDTHAARIEIALSRVLRRL